MKHMKSAKKYMEEEKQFNVSKTEDENCSEAENRYSKVHARFCLCNESAVCLENTDVHCCYSNHTVTPPPPGFHNDFNNMTSHERTLLILYILWKIIYMFICTFTLISVVIGACLRERFDSLDGDVVQLRDIKLSTGLLNEFEDNLGGSYVRETERLSLVHGECVHCLGVIFNSTWSQVSLYGIIQKKLSQ